MTVITNIVIGYLYNMTKAFTQSNKDQIKRSLLKKGREYFIRYGLKKTSIDELVKAVGIAKGSFYKFFDSKGALFMAIHEESEEKFRTNMMQKLTSTKEPIDKLRIFFMSSFTLMEEDPLLQILFNKEEYENLAIFLSSSYYKLHRSYDIVFLEELIKQWQAEGIVRQLDAKVASNMIALVYQAIIQKGTLSTAMYTKVKHMLFECLSKYLVDSQ